MKESEKLIERMKEHNINSYEELCHCLRVHDAAFINDFVADAIEALTADINNAIQHIPHICTTCRYWTLTGECVNPDLKTPCYKWIDENWEWNGKPKEL